MQFFIYDVWETEIKVNIDVSPDSDQSLHVSMNIAEVQGQSVMVNISDSESLATLIRALSVAKAAIDTDAKLTDQGE